MDLRVLQYFLAVAREQNISAAAQSLHLSQPTLSTQLKHLEAELGKPLLIRGSKGSRKVTLTEEGMLLRKRAEEILSLVRKTENEIAQAEETIAGEVFIGTGETQTIRLFAKAAHQLKKRCPLIRYHITSGNSVYVLEQLDKGLIDFGLVYGPVDPAQYQALKIPIRDVWGVLMRRDSPLAQKEAVCAEDLWDKPLILSIQRGDDGPLYSWLRKDREQLNIVATYNLLFNASLLTSEGLGYTICFDRLIQVEGNDNLCFRPLSPRLECEASIVWKRYQVLSRAAEAFLRQLQETFSQAQLLPCLPNHPQQP